MLLVRHIWAAQSLIIAIWPAGSVEEEAGGRCASEPPKFTCAMRFLFLFGPHPYATSSAKYIAILWLKS